MTHWLFELETTAIVYQLSKAAVPKLCTVALGAQRTLPKGTAAYGS